MSILRTAILPKGLFTGIRRERPQIRVSRVVVESAAMDAAGVYERLGTRPEGLTSEEAEARLSEHGPNVLAKDQRPGFGKLLWHAVINPLVVLLAVLAAISFATGDDRAGVVMSLMIAPRSRPEAHSGGPGRPRCRQAEGDDLGHGDRAPRRRAAGNLRLAARAGRRGAARRGGHDPRRRADGLGQGSVRRSRAR